MIWLERHKLFACVAVVSLVLFFSIRKIIASQELQAHDRVVLAEHQLEVDKSAQKAADAQALTDRNAYNLLKSQLDSQNSALKGQITLLAASLKAQQDKDRVLPPSELAERATVLIGGIPGDVKSVPDGLLMTIPAARTTVVMLEEVPADRETIQKQQNIIANKDLMLDSLAKRAESADNAVLACKKTQESQDAACKAQIVELRAKARKRNVIIAVLGALFGFGIRSQI